MAMLHISPTNLHLQATLKKTKTKGHTKKKPISSLFIELEGL